MVNRFDLKVDVVLGVSFIFRYEYFMNIQKSRDPGILNIQTASAEAIELRQRCIVGLATQIVYQLLTTRFHEKIFPNFHEFLHKSDHVLTKLGKGQRIPKNANMN